MLKKGLIQVYTNQGNFTNFAPMGLSLRAAGHGFRSHITCFYPFPFMEGASSVIEMREIKHPFRKGINARKGIEF